MKLLIFCGDAPRPTLCQLLHDPTSLPAKFNTINQSQQNKFKNARMKQLFLPVPQSVSILNSAADIIDAFDMIDLRITPTSEH